MDKKVINEEQFRKLVLNEAQKILSEENTDSTPEENKAPESKRKVTFDKVESLIKEMENMPKSISSISIEEEIVKSESSKEDLEETWTPNQDRDLDVVEHNKKKNITHVNEGEKDKWRRMLDYNIPKDEER